MSEAQQYFRQMTGTGPLFKQGLLFLFLAPRDIYAFFDKGMRYHFLRYLAILDALACLYLFFTSMFNGVMHFIFLLIVTAISVGPLLWLSAFVDRFGGWLSWHPGLGYRTKNGSFKPLFGGGTMKGSGAAKAGETLVRGSAVVNGVALANEMKAGVSAADLAALVHIGGVPVPYMSEQQGFLFSGSPGAGKTQSINELLRTVRRRGQAALIADPAGGYLSRFFRPGDLILNPFDARTEHWSPFAEIVAPYDCLRIAKAAIPDAAGESQEWHFYAQTLLSETLRALHDRGERSIKELLRVVMSAEPKELVDVLKGTSAAQLTVKGNEKMLSNTRAIASVYLNSWNYLQDGGTFSLRKWVQQSDASGGQWLYVTYKSGQLAMLKHLIAGWLDIAQSEGLELTESRSRRLWFVMDELDSLGKVGTLKMGLTQLRKYGGVIVAGLQFLSQLQTTYGKEEAKTLLAAMASKLILRVDEAEGAEAMSRTLGDQEVLRPETSSSTSSRAGEMPSSSENHSVRTVEQRTVMASEITTLPDMQGFLKLPGYPIARVELEYVPAPDIFPAFVAKEAA